MIDLRTLVIFAYVALSPSAPCRTVSHLGCPPLISLGSPLTKHLLRRTSNKMRRGTASYWSCSRFWATSELTLPCDPPFTHILALSILEDPSSCLHVPLLMPSLFAARSYLRLCTSENNTYILEPPFRCNGVHLATEYRCQHALHFPQSRLYPAPSQLGGPSTQSPEC